MHLRMTTQKRRGRIRCVYVIEDMHALPYHSLYLMAYCRVFEKACVK